MSACIGFGCFVSYLCMYQKRLKRFYILCLYHRLSNRPTKRGKEKSPSDGHYQCQKEMDDHLLACQQVLTRSHIVTRLANERAPFLKINDINDIAFFGRLTAIIVGL
jgi:hypothetical protein